MQFTSVTNMAAWARDAGPARIVADLVEALEVDFRRWPAFDLVPRLATHSSDGVIELMPASDGEQYAFKYVNGHPENPQRGLQTVTAFGVLADVYSGYPTFLAEMTLLTALRTAATSALAARWLAAPGCRTMAMIGAGSQAEFQALGMRSQLGIDRLRVVDVDPRATAKLQRNLTPLGFEVEVCATASAAVDGADVITTCTADKANATVLHLGDVRPGVHVNAIGGDCPGKTELDPRILDAATVVVVEHTPQTRIEGEIQQKPADFPVTELHEVIRGLRPGRTAAEQITVFDSVGFALEDFTALRFVRDAVRGTRYSETLDLLTDPEDPKDLFGILGAPAPVA
ncbi:ornithine cyclodeaminase [Kineococcus xinjiangensis]|uniref:Ornithine cyclodeaminase n=1 Tax=Kineococcus xinjiangensis TaxID=512762 RepID=A0A2S6IK30_9ACTN|nr:ornithine cyclodeaminase [Kineococcus xinjiangensis]PPK94558.1 ornithine cyclodeaminase [Kineococcus xinjiangensis]